MVHRDIFNDPGLLPGGFTYIYTDLCHGHRRICQLEQEQDGRKIKQRK